MAYPNQISVAQEIIS